MERLYKALVCREKSSVSPLLSSFFFFQAEDGIRDYKVTGVQTCALPISRDTVTLVPYRALEAGEFSQVGELRATPPAPDFARRLQLVSRFPQGLTPDMLARLLAAHRQSALKVVAR